MVWFYICIVFLITLCVSASVSSFKLDEKLDGFFGAFLGVFLVVIMCFVTYHYGKIAAVKQVFNNEYGWRVEKIYKDSVLIKTDSTYVLKKSIE